MRVKPATRESLRVIAAIKTRHKLEVEEIIETMKVIEEIEQKQANRQLRDRIVWCLISSMGFEGILILLNSLDLITLPQVVLVAISVMMGGSGLVAALLIVMRDLFPRK
jgi:hypothetical protein